MLTMLPHLATSKADKTDLISHDDQNTTLLFCSRMEHMFDAASFRVACMTPNSNDSIVIYWSNWPSGSPHPSFYSNFLRPEKKQFKGVSWPSWTPSSSNLGSST